MLQGKRKEQCNIAISNKVIREGLMEKMDSSKELEEERKKLSCYLGEECTWYI